ncbi:hypothetical protein [Shewanella baltica]|nr:hypothetical protein [Shewanella baltica]
MSYAALIVIVFPVTRRKLIPEGFDGDIHVANGHCCNNANLN